MKTEASVVSNVWVTKDIYMSLVSGLLIAGSLHCLSLEELCTVGRFLIHLINAQIICYLMLVNT